MRARQWSCSLFGVIASLFHDAKFNLSLSNPLYDRTKKCVRELEPLAWQIPRIHAIKTARRPSPPMSAENEKMMSSWDEFLQSVSMKELADTSDIEAEEAQRMHSINTNPEVRSTMLLVHEWLETNHKQPGLDLFSALDVYKDLSKNNKWRAKKLMRLCTMMACNEFELASADMSAVDAEQLWDKAVQLYRKIRSEASRPDATNIDRVQRSKVFKDLGIKLKFPKGLAKVNSSRRRVAGPWRFFLRIIKIGPASASSSG